MAQSWKDAKHFAEKAKQRAHLGCSVEEKRAERLARKKLLTRERRSSKRVALDNLED